MSLHRWVRHNEVPDLLRTGWMALPTLEGTHHGAWSAHCVWLCDCRPPLPRCANPEIDDYPPWLLGATRMALSEIMDGANLEDARFVLQTIDAAIKASTPSVPSPVAARTPEQSS